MSQIQVILRAERRPMLAWAGGLGAFVLLLGAIYASFDDPRQLDELLENYPEDLLEVFGDVQDIGSVKGFLSIELTSYMPLVVGIFSVMLMSKHLAGAEERGELDHLLARPVSRGRYYWGLYGAGAIVLTVMLLGAGIGGVLGFALAGTGPRELLGVIGLLLEFLPLGLVYLGIGGLAGTLFHRRGLANALGISIVVLFFVLDVTGRLVPDLEWIGYLTPHGHLARSDLFDGELGLGYVAFCAFLAAASAEAGARIFETKDLHA